MRAKILSRAYAKMLLILSANSPITPYLVNDHFTLHLAIKQGIDDFVKLFLPFFIHHLKFLQLNLQLLFEEKCQQLLTSTETNMEASAKPSDKDNGFYLFPYNLYKRT